jgi:hypothetical protein
VVDRGGALAAAVEMTCPLDCVGFEGVVDAAVVTESSVMLLPITVITMAATVGTSAAAMKMAYAAIPPCRVEILRRAGHGHGVVAARSGVSMRRQAVAVPLPA